MNVKRCSKSRISLEDAGISVDEKVPDGHFLTSFYWLIQNKASSDRVNQGSAWEFGSVLICEQD